MNQLGRIGKLNQKANRTLKKIYQDKGITFCECCGTDFALGFAHKEKRRAYYSTPEKLSSFQETLLLCINCHGGIEYDKEKTQILFSRLRGEE